MKVLIEYATEAEILSQDAEGYKVRYSERDATIEKVIKYKPLNIDGLKGRYCTGWEGRWII